MHIHIYIFTVVTSCERREKREGGRERKRENFANVSAESLGGRREERGRGGNEDEIVWRISRGGGGEKPSKTRRRCVNNWGKRNSRFRGARKLNNVAPIPRETELDPRRFRHR